MRIAVFGGTFDPPHIGHTTLAHFVLEHHHAEAVLFVPAYVPPHKSSADITPFQHRFAMLKLVTAENSGFAISDIEARERREPSYTYDTLLSLEKSYPDDELLLMLGYDSLLQLHTWFKCREIMQRWQLLTYPRRLDHNPDRDKSLLTDWWNREECDILLNSVINADTVAVSSTAIRQHLANGTAVDGLIADNVMNYIKQHNLYGYQ